MSQFQDRINKLKPYVISIRFIESSTIIDVVLKDGWVPPSNPKISAKKSADSGVNYIMIYSEHASVTLDDLLDYIELSINVNIEREKKIELFKQKVKDMEELFKNASLNELENMKFNLKNETFSPDLFTPDFTTKSEPMEELMAPNEVVDLSNDDEYQEKEIPFPTIETMKETLQEKNNKLNTKIKTMDFDLPPKPNEKIVVEDFPEVASVCKCGPNESCEACIGDY